MQFFQSTLNKKSFSLDPRTKIFIMIAASGMLISGSNGKYMNVIQVLLSSLPFILYVVSGYWKTGLKFALLYIAVFMSGVYIMPLANGILGFILVAVVGIVTRFLPSVALGVYMVSSTTVSEFIAGMERMHMPQKITIPFAVMFRFFPTIAEETSSINDAMKMRGVRLGGGKASNMLEYRMVPLMMSIVKIGEELSAASLTRGLGGIEKRTNICHIGFSIWDIVIFMFIAFCFVLNLF